jgi:hypothetical protein
MFPKVGCSSHPSAAWAECVMRAPLTKASATRSVLVYLVLMFISRARRLGLRSREAARQTRPFARANLNGSFRPSTERIRFPDSVSILNGDPIKVATTIQRRSLALSSLCTSTDVEAPTQTASSLISRSIALPSPRKHGQSVVYTSLRRPTSRSRYARSRTLRMARSRATTSSRSPIVVVTSSVVVDIDTDGAPVVAGSDLPVRTIAPTAITRPAIRTTKVNLRRCVPVGGLDPGWRTSAMVSLL